MATEEVKIRDLTHDEITGLIQICHALFNSGYLSDHQITAYTNVLRHKFPLLTYDRVMKSCEDAAANPPKADIKFSPSYLSIILRSNERLNQNQSFDERVTTQSERYEYRQQFLKDLYADFDAFKAGAKCTRIHAWQYVAELFINAGIAEQLPVHKEQRGDTKSIKDLMSIYESFVQDCFKILIKNNQHVSEIIHGF